MKGVNMTKLDVLKKKINSIQTGLDNVINLIETGEYEIIAYEFNVLIDKAFEVFMEMLCNWIKHLPYELRVDTIDTIVSSVKKPESVNFPEHEWIQVKTEDQTESKA